MYILKIKGKSKIPDYIQIRDDNFTLIDYFRVDRPIKNLDKIGLADKEEYIKSIIPDLPFGKLTHIE
jgi:hypothetical protein